MVKLMHMNAVQLAVQNRQGSKVRQLHALKQVCQCLLLFAKVTLRPVLVTKYQLAWNEPT